jgi:hypothetical protein
LTRVAASAASLTLASCATDAWIEPNRSRDMTPAAVRALLRFSFL